MGKNIISFKTPFSLLKNRLKPISELYIEECDRFCRECGYSRERATSIFLQAFEESLNETIEERYGG